MSDRPSRPAPSPAPASAAGADPQRPRYHLTPRSGWMNDPNGLIRWKGRTHLFFQHNPIAAEWGPPHWGHVVSDDLVRWEERPVALTPEMPPADDGGCWSGCAVDDGGTPTLVYTGVKEGEQTTCLAFGDDELEHWRKYEGNPVQGTPHHIPITHASYRDPFVWRGPDGWHAVVGVSIGHRGEVLLYRSADLRAWEELGPLVDPSERDLHSDEAHTWECPNFVPLGDRHALIVSLATPELLKRPLAFVGRFDGRRFTPHGVQRVDGGYHGFYAPLTMAHEDGRRLMWGWLQEQRPREAQLAAGWSGAMSLPRELTLGADGRLDQRFARELCALRGDGVRHEGLALEGARPVEGLGGHELELLVELERGDADRAGVTLRHGPHDATRLWVDWKAGVLASDRGGTNADGTLRWKGVATPFERLGDRVRLHLFVDRSTVEAIADDRVALTVRTYPRAYGDGAVELTADGGAARAGAVEGWHLRLPEGASA